MKSFYAVIGQMVLSGSNYLIFLIFTVILSETHFINFSTAVALNILAYAVAEGGISFVAPREISKKDKTKPILSGGFIFISIFLYFIAITVGFNLWNFFSKDSLNIYWVVSYAFYFFPVLIIPSWLTCWSIDLTKLIVLSIVRGLSIVLVYFIPTSFGLLISGALFLVFILFFVNWLNKDEPILKTPNLKSIYVAKNMIMEVFVSKTSSYVVYSLIPLVVASIYGNKISSLYIIGERIKSMYATLFQPLIQTVYLSINKDKKVKKSNLMPYSIALINVLITMILIFVIYNNGVSFIGERFNSVPNLYIYIVSACLSILTACLLYFKVLPTGNYKLFRIATYFQMGVFILLFIFMKFNDFLQPETVLLFGELSILLIVFIQLLLNKIRL